MTLKPGSWHWWPARPCSACCWPRPRPCWRDFAWFPPEAPRAGLAVGSRGGEGHPALMCLFMDDLALVTCLRWRLAAASAAQAAVPVPLLARFLVGCCPAGPWGECSWELTCLPRQGRVWSRPVPWPLSEDPRGASQVENPQVARQGRGVCLLQLHPPAGLWVTLSPPAPGRLPSCWISLYLFL